MLKILAAAGLVCILAGCADITIRDGGLALTKDTTATIEDMSAVRVTSKY